MSAQGPLSYVAIVSHGHSSTPPTSWGCRSPPRVGGPAWEPAPAPPAPLMTSQPHGVMHLPPAAELLLRSEAMCPGTQVGSSPTPAHHQCHHHHHPTARALLKQQLNTDTEKSEQRPWRKEMTSHVKKPNYIKIVILGNSVNFVGLPMFMSWCL